MEASLKIRYLTLTKEAIVLICDSTGSDFTPSCVITNTFLYEYWVQVHFLHVKKSIFFLDTAFLREYFLIKSVNINMDVVFYRVFNINFEQTACLGLGRTGG